MVGITYLYIDTISAFYGYFLFFFFLTHLYCLVGYLSMIVWTHVVLDVLYACVLYFCICTCSAQLSMFHMERRSRNTLIIMSIMICLTVCMIMMVFTARVCWHWRGELLCSRNTLIIISIICLTVYMILMVFSASACWHWRSCCALEILSLSSVS